MKPLCAFLILCALLFAPAIRADDEGADDRFVAIYGLILAGDAAADKGKSTDAFAKYKEANTKLKKLREDYPEWNVKVVKYRIEYLAAKLADAPKTTPSANAGEPVALRLKWEAGKRYLKRLDSTQMSEISIPGQGPIKQEQKTTLEYAVSAVKELEGGGKELEMEIVSMAMKAEPEEAANPLAAVIGKIAGSKLRLKAHASGKVESVENLEEFLGRIGEGNPGASARIGGIFSADSIKEMVSMEEGLPDRPVRIGDTWQIKQEDAMGPMGIMVDDMKYTFKSWEQRDNRRCAVLTYSGNISIKPGGDMPAGMVTVDRGVSSGTTWFDPAAGIVIETQADNQIGLKLNREGRSMGTKMRHVIGGKMVSMTDVPK